MRFETFISLRYLLTRQRAGLLSIITLISVGGVAVGVTALIIVISVMDGFDHDLIKKMAGVYSHIEVAGRKGGGMPTKLRNYEQLARNLEKHEEVIAAAPLVKQQALVQADTGIETEKVGVVVYGIIPEREIRTSNIEENLLSGRLPKANREVLIGKVLAQRLGVGLDGKLWSVTKLARTANGPMAKTSSLKVVGVFESGWYEFDANLIYVTLETAQAIFLMDDVADMIHLKLKDPFRAHQVRDTLKDYIQPASDYISFGETLTALSWEERSPDFFRALALEKLAMFIILLLIVIVASFNIIGTLIMMVIEKTREIGVLRALGCGTRQIMLIFILQGVFIGFAGTLLGVGLGLLGCHAIANWLTLELPSAVYGIEKLPVIVSGRTTGIIVVSAMVICILASIVPALQACRLKTVEALRYE